MALPHDSWQAGQTSPFCPPAPPSPQLSRQTTGARSQPAEPCASEAPLRNTQIQDLTPLPPNTKALPCPRTPWGLPSHLLAGTPLPLTRATCPSHSVLIPDFPKLLPSKTCLPQPGSCDPLPSLPAQGPSRFLSPGDLQRGQVWAGERRGHKRPGPLPPSHVVASPSGLPARPEVHPSRKPRGGRAPGSWEDGLAGWGGQPPALPETLGYKPALTPAAARPEGITRVPDRDAQVWRGPRRPRGGAGGGCRAGGGGGASAAGPAVAYLRTAPPHLPRARGRSSRKRWARPAPAGTRTGRRGHRARSDPCRLPGTETPAWAGPGRSRSAPLWPVPASLRCPGCPTRGGSSEQWSNDVSQRPRDPPEQGQGSGGRAQTPASGRGRSCPWGA